MNKPPNNWNHYENHPLHPEAKSFWQKVVLIDDLKIGVDFISYPPIKKVTEVWTHELHIQIPKSISITEMTLNINNFSYSGKRIDWKQIEQQVDVILKANIKKDKLSIDKIR